MPKLAAFVGALIGLSAIAVGAQERAAEPLANAEFKKGVDYIELPVRVETRDPSKIEVVEVFSYACVHCYRLEPVLSRWLQSVPDDVDFHRLPLVTQRLVPFAQAFFAARTLGVVERIHMPMFAAIHEYGMDMSRREYVRRLFVRDAEVDDAEFLRVIDSFGVQSRVRQADAQGRMYRIRATPSIVVNGRYVTEAGQTGSNEAMFLVVNALIASERAANAESAPAADD